MAAVNRAIPALFQGVSQQPAAIRAAEQVEALENCYVTVADGARKRPSTMWINYLGLNSPDDPKVHQYARGDAERYAIVIGSDPTTPLVEVYDTNTGAAKTVDLASFPAARNYLRSDNARTRIGALTVADTTFLWNRDVTVEAAASTIAAETQYLFVHVKEGRAETSYGIGLGTYGSADVVTTSTAATYSTIAIATALQAAIAALPGGGDFTVTVTGSLLAIRKNTGSPDFPWVTYDSQGNTLMTAFKNRVERYSDLPRVFVEGVTVEVRGQADAAGKSSFFVKYESASNEQTGHWVETLAPVVDQIETFEPGTMPVALVRLGDGTFRLETIDWTPRLVGSTETTCVPPSFLGAKVESMFYSRERIGILTGENVVMSRARSIYNFWPKSAADVNDDDPIDVTVGGTKIATLRHAVPFQRTLMLFSDNTQFPLTGGETLTSRNVRADPGTEFDCSSLVPPVSSGMDLFFVFQRSGAGVTHSGVREYFVNQQSNTNDAVDVTAHVPDYIPKEVFEASVSSTEDVLLLVSSEEPNRVYCYKYLWDGEKRVQSAWGRWTFRPSDVVLSAHVDRSVVYLVIMRADGMHLELLNLQATALNTDLSFPLYLDSLVAVDMTNPVSGAVYIPPFDRTTVPAPELFRTGLMPSGEEGELVVVAGAEFGTKAGAVIPYTRQTGGSWAITMLGDWTGGTLFMGVRYESRLTFSELFMRDQANNAIQQGRLQVKHMTVNFQDAATFRAEVATPGRDTAVYRWTGMQLGIIGSLVGTPVFRSDSFTFPVASESSRATISLVNDSPYSCTWYSAEWEGFFTTRSRRV